MAPAPQVEVRRTRMVLASTGAVVRCSLPERWTGRLRSVAAPDRHQGGGCWRARDPNSRCAPSPPGSFWRRRSLRVLARLAWRKARERPKKECPASGASSCARILRLTVLLAYPCTAPEQFPKCHRCLMFCAVSPAPSFIDLWACQTCSRTASDGGLKGMPKPPDHWRACERRGNAMLARINSAPADITSAQPSLPIPLASPGSTASAQAEAAHHPDRCVQHRPLAPAQQRPGSPAGSATKAGGKHNSNVAPR